ncbi:hypothetical protein [Mangrovimonas futianensis]|uniref:hypothetical protein n=1 Tax=Mangrovimonas futianensis TaxID=2895523 RepID=UPI001E61592E|nr:hypothetical protein [Mangrovimonas futianensis]MCF1421790.1 hypothetical protein [Mangrovimonas futianensis]
MFLIIFSCQPIIKVITGVKNPTILLDNSERLKYYSPFFETHSYPIKIYALKDTTALKNGFSTFKSYPQIYLNHRKTNTTYFLNCYDDLELYIKEDINEKKYENLYQVANDSLTNLKDFIEEYSTIVYQKEHLNSNSNVWDVFIVSGTFLGNKIRRKSLPLTQIEDLNYMYILDLSINKNEIIQK